MRQRSTNTVLRHRSQEVRELIPSDQGGVMHTDRALTYDAWALELLAQQKCDHIIRSIDKVLEDKAGSVRAFGETLKTLLKDAIALWQRYHAGGVDDYTREAQNITQAIDRHLKPRSLDDPDNQRLLDQIGWHHAGGSLLPFLDQPEGAEPTNNRAERALCPGVTARKVSHCSKSADGARTLMQPRPSSRPHANVESLWSAGSWTCSVLTIRHLIRFLPTPLPVHPDNIQPSGHRTRPHEKLPR